jgi:hypothetical protein
MQGTLVVTILAIQSSYLRNVERPLVDDTETPDTIQWWIAPSGTWRIRTYAIDHDIHTHSIGGAANFEGLALANANKHYGDVVRSHHTIELSNCFDTDETNAAFRVEGLEPRIEIASGRFAFWKPDEAQYHTQSKPE